MLQQLILLGLSKIECDILESSDIVLDLNEIFNGIYLKLQRRAGRVKDQNSELNSEVIFIYKFLWDSQSWSFLFLRETQLAFPNQELHSSECKIKWYQEY